MYVDVSTGGRGGLWWRVYQTAEPQAGATLAKVSQSRVFRWAAALAVPRNAWNPCGVPAGGEGPPASDCDHVKTAWSFKVRLCVCDIKSSALFSTLFQFMTVHSNANISRQHKPLFSSPQTRVTGSPQDDTIRETQASSSPPRVRGPFLLTGWQVKFRHTNTLSAPRLHSFWVLFWLLINLEHLVFLWKRKEKKKLPTNEIQS